MTLLTACGTARMAHFDSGQSQHRQYSPSTSNTIKVGPKEFEGALTQLILDIPLSLRSNQQDGVVLVSYPTGNTSSRWKRLMSQSFNGLCEANPRGRDCLSLLDDVMGLSEWDKLGIALGLSLKPMKESISEAVRDTLAPQLFYTVIATGLITWATLAANPEPVFTKAAAIISVVLLLYLGQETFLELVDASRELKRTTDEATTPKELEQAAQRFAHRVGPQVARLFVLAATVVVSHGLTEGAAWLATRLSVLPGLPEAAAAGVSGWGVNLANVGEVTTVSVVGSTISISIPAAAVAMAAQGGGGGSTAGNGSSFRSWGSFNGLKNALGPAGQGNEWHHIVEQTQGNVTRFGPHTLHNTQNVVSIEKELHARLSAFYSRKRFFLTNSENVTVREWLSTQSFEAQREFGLQAIENIRKGIWR